jgi:hypothetical protein
MELFLNLLDFLMILSFKRLDQDNIKSHRKELLLIIPQLLDLLIDLTLMLIIKILKDQVTMI